MRIFNTLTRTKQEFVPIEPGKVRIYACGPTVYNYIHIGNARPLCVFDVLRRYLEYREYDVTFVQNFTDIDDKIIKKANEEGTDYKTVSEKYIKEFWTDADGLNFKHATIHPKATENIDKIIEIVKTAMPMRSTETSISARIPSKNTASSRISPLRSLRRARE